MEEFMKQKSFFRMFLIDPIDVDSFDQTHSDQRRSWFHCPKGGHSTGDRTSQVCDLPKIDGCPK